jgi:hypothetical protein
MVVEERSLSLTEGPNVSRLLGIYTHSPQRFIVGHGRDDQPICILEADEAPVEQMVYGRCQQESILPVQAYARRCKTRPQCAARAVFRGGVKAGHRRILVL